MSALAGIVVLDLSRVLAGPYAAQIMADLGATVVKIENPADLDVARGFPPFLHHDGEEFSAYYAQYNRGKLGLTLDLSGDEGRRVLKDLVAAADGWCTWPSPGTARPARAAAARPSTAPPRRPVGCGR